MNNTPIINNKNNLKLNNNALFIHGKIVKGKVVAIIQKNYYLISIRNKKFITYSEKDFNIGDYIKARVKGTFPEITLQLVDENRINDEIKNTNILLSKLNLLINDNLENKFLFNLIINFNKNKFFLKNFFNEFLSPENKNLKQYFHSFKDIISFFSKFKNKAILSNFFKLFSALKELQKHNPKDEIKNAIEHLQGTLFFNIFNEKFFFVPFIFYYNNSWEEFFFRFNKKQPKEQDLYSLNIFLKPTEEIHLLINFLLNCKNNYFDLKFTSNNRDFLKTINNKQQLLISSFVHSKPRLRNISLNYDTKNLENEFFYINTENSDSQIIDYIA